MYYAHQLSFKLKNKLCAKKKKLIKCAKKTFTQNRWGSINLIRRAQLPALLLFYFYFYS